MGSIQKRIAFSFGVTSCAFFLMTVLTFSQVDRVTESSRRIQNILEPSIEANLKLTIAINASLVSLQSWVLVEDAKFVRRRLAIWSVIEKNHKQLENYSSRWGDEKQIERLDSISQFLLVFKEQQESIEETAHTSQRARSVRFLKEQHSPMGDQIIAELRHISDPQKWEMRRVFVTEERQERILKNSSIVFLFLSIVGSASLGVLLTRAVIVPINRTVRLAEAVSRGDYSSSSKLFSGEEKLDVALRAMTRQLREKSEENMLQKQELEKYNQELEVSNEELSQFSYRTSHDLRSPLITVRGLADAIYEDIVDGEYEEAKRNARLISSRVKKLENLIIDILDLAKADLEVAEKEYVDVEDVISGILERLGSVYLDCDIKIETDIDKSAKLYVSRVRITQILENLISNSMKYRDPDKTDRFIKISTKHDGNQDICVVEDNGVGIPEEFTDQVFGMFRRFHPEISYGSGLGMYIIKKHVDRMEAHIAFSSSPEGTRIEVKLPGRVGG